MGSSLKTLRIVMVGPIASDKATISKSIIKEFPNFVHISPGDIMRREVQQNTKLGQQVKTYVTNGTFIPDEFIVDIIFEELERCSKKNCILDGFPRTIRQAELLHGIESLNKSDESGCKCLHYNEGLLKNSIDGVLHLIIPDEIIIERTSKRWIHIPSGRSYSVGLHEPRIKWKDDVTGEDLVQRLDDKPEVVAERIKIYKYLTEPVLDFYRCHKINILDLDNQNTENSWPIAKTFLSELSEKCTPAY